MENSQGFNTELGRGGQREPAGSDACPFERPAIDKQQTILTSPAEGAWQVRVLAHPDPLYRIEGEPGRRPEWHVRPYGLNRGSRNRGGNSGSQQAPLAIKRRRD